jgi:hypothetical protein
MSPAEVSPLLSASSILLAAFGFLYASRDDMASAVEARSYEESSRIEARTKAVRAVRRTKAIPLALASTLVAVLFFPPSLTMIREGLGDGSYELLKAAFVLMEGFWVFVAMSRLWLVWKLGRTLSGLKQNLRRLHQGSTKALR